MNKIAVLDCTLRDGGYIVDKYFGESVITGIVNGLVEAGVDYVEIGFLQNEGHADGKTIFLNSKDAQKYIPNNRKKTMFTVLADYSRYDIKNLDTYTGESFDCVRACFFKSEREQVIDFCKEIKRKGYKLFVQPVDILGYSDYEILDLIKEINMIEPYCFSIVDTFGSMYEKDLDRVFQLIDHNLVSSCSLGFHSHNNLQMSNALSQSFIEMGLGKRDVVVDSTLSGMGRGAGNTPTELIVQYLVSQKGKDYDLDYILDSIDMYINNISLKNKWGYNTSYFIAGCFSAHVNNIAYLLKKNSITSKDIRYIVNSLSKESRKKYDYDLLEEAYINYINLEADDSDNFTNLKEILSGKNILLLAPGKSLLTEQDKINQYIEKNNSIIIAINRVPEFIEPDFVYMNSVKHYKQWINESPMKSTKLIVASNVHVEKGSNCIVISAHRLMKAGWQHMDNSAIWALRMLNQLEVAKIGIAGMDGFSHNLEKNYVDKKMEIANIYDDFQEINKEIKEMLNDFMYHKRSDLKVEFVTTSRFA